MTSLVFHQDHKFYFYCGDYNAHTSVESDSNDILSEPMTEGLNYIIEKRDSLQCWAERVHSTIYEGWNYNLPENYIGTMILPIPEECMKSLLTGD